MKLLKLKEEKEIQRKIKSGDVTIGIYGAGKVGLPIAVVFAEVGANVIAVDIDEKVVDRINRGENPIKNEAELDEKFSNVMAKGNMRASVDLIQSAKDSDVMIVIVPTILGENFEFNIGPLSKVFNSIGRGLEVDDLVILESTVPPNFVEQNIRPILEKISGLEAGRDFGLGFSPERVFSGRIIPDLVSRYPKVVSGVDQRTTEVMAALYGIVAQKGVIKLSNIRTAEAMKVFEGIYRDVNIGLANELALVAEKLQIDILELINAANSQPFSNILIPGAGVGGHCIPVYPYFIINHGAVKELDLKIITAARKVNEYMPYHMVELVELGLAEINKSIKNINLTIMGLAFRGDVKEHRNAPSLKLAEILKEKLKNIKCFDPLYTVNEISKILNVNGVESLEEAFQDSDCLIFMTDHKMFETLDLKEYMKKMRAPGLIIDGRQIFNPKKVLELGLQYKGVGRVVKK